MELGIWIFVEMSHDDENVENDDEVRRLRLRLPIELCG